MIETEQRSEAATVRLDASRRHGVDEPQRKLALFRVEAHGMVLSSEQRSAFDHVTNVNGVSAVVGGKSAMPGVAREVWESADYSVRCAAQSGIAAENLEGGSGIASRTGDMIPDL